jgi:intracellular sulfur oxidation DsrE/DsrF family protein
MQVAERWRIATPLAELTSDHTWRGTMRRTTILPLLSGILVFLFAQYSPTIAQTRTDAAQTAKKAVSPTQGKNSAAARVARKGPHRLALQVNSNDPAAMNLALNNASNVAQYYQETGEPVEIEIVAYGPGLHMLRDDTSPVKPRLKSISESIPTISFKACGNTQQNMQKAEEKDVPLVAQATVVKSGVVRLMELQEQGWSYIRP